MSSKPPPPPRPDLEADSSVPAAKQSRSAPPPIPLRTDLGEGVNNDVSNASVARNAPDTLPKRTGSKKFQGRPEITIVSAQPMAATGAFTPFEQHSSTQPSSLPKSQSLPVTSFSESSESNTAFPNQIPGPPAVTKPTPSATTSIPGTPVVDNPNQHQSASPTAFKPAQSFPAPIPGPPAVTKPAPPVPIIPGPPPINKPNQTPSASVAKPGPATAFKPPPSSPASTSSPSMVARPAPPVPIPGPPATNKPSPSLPASIPGPPTIAKPAPYGSASNTASTAINKPVLTPTVLTPKQQTDILKPTHQISPKESSLPGQSPSPQRVPKSTKSRPPPQRPKSKPVCDPMLTGDVLLTPEVEPPKEPVAPVRKKNKPSKPTQESQFDLMKDFGMSNSAFQELEPSNEFSNFDTIKDVKIEQPTVSSSKKSKPFPTVIRTKPNGKENVSNSGSAGAQEHLEDSKEINVNKSKSVKPTVIKTQGKAKPPPPSIKSKQDYSSPQDEVNTGNPFEMAPLEPEAQQVKSKSKPTIIIPKVKKDSSDSKETKKTDNIYSPESNKSDNESKSYNAVEQTSKPKRIPSIIRPNRPKKDKKDAQNSRGMPEGQSKESSPNTTKLIPARKAPPRPSPPKPGPPRPGPPKKVSNEPKTPVDPINTQPRASPPGTVATSVGQHDKSHKGKAPAPRPATIGKDKESEDPKAIERHKKKVDSTVVSSVVATQIEPSAIALYDYAGASPDDLSFNAGDEIFLVKRINNEWYVGRCNGGEGMLPIKFVEIIEDLPPEQEMPASSKIASKPPSLSTIVLYDFQGQSHDELTLHAGDTVQLLEIINDEWLKGQLNGITGIFPSNFVDLSENMKQNLLQQKTDSKLVKNNQELQRKNTSITISSGPRCKALYEYHTDNTEDLSFDKDDIIKLVERINDEWLKGELHGTTGMFPVAFVDIVEDLKVVPSSSKKDASSLPVVQALHDYISSTAGDLSFKEGDIITVVDKINDEWLDGELDGQRGIFPSTFIKNIQESSLALGKSFPEDHQLPKGRALYDFTGETDQELTFKAGDEIILLKQINEDWMEGELHNHIGQFPSAFVEVLIPLP